MALKNISNSTFASEFFANDKNDDNSILPDKAVPNNKIPLVNLTKSPSNEEFLPVSFQSILVSPCVVNNRKEYILDSPHSESILSVHEQQNNESDGGYVKIPLITREDEDLEVNPYLHTHNDNNNPCIYKQSVLQDRMTMSTINKDNSKLSNSSQDCTQTGLDCYGTLEAAEKQVNNILDDKENDMNKDNEDGFSSSSSSSSSSNSSESSSSCIIVSIKSSRYKDENIEPINISSCSVTDQKITTNDSCIMKAHEQNKEGRQEYESTVVPKVVECKVEQSPSSNQPISSLESVLNQSFIDLKKYEAHIYQQHLMVKSVLFSSIYGT